MRFSSLFQVFFVIWSTSFYKDARKSVLSTSKAKKSFFCQRPSFLQLSLQNTDFSKIKFFKSPNFHPKTSDFENFQKFLFQKFTKSTTNKQSFPIFKISFLKIAYFLNKTLASKQIILYIFPSKTNSIYREIT